MVTLALDVGDRRIGAAVADPEGRLATPLGAVPRRDVAGTRAAVAAISGGRAVTHLLVGVPLGPNGEETARATAIRAFATTLAEGLGVPVTFRDERNTTQDALARARATTESPDGRRRGARRAPSPHAREAARRRIDAMAAAVLLQAHLDEARTTPGREAASASGSPADDGVAAALAQALADALLDDGGETPGTCEDHVPPAIARAGTPPFPTREGRNGE